MLAQANQGHKSHISTITPKLKQPISLNKDCLSPVLRLRAYFLLYNSGKTRILIIWKMLQKQYFKIKYIKKPRVYVGMDAAMHASTPNVWNETNMHVKCVKHTKHMNHAKWIESQTNNSIIPALLSSLNFTTRFGHWELFQILIQKCMKDPN